MHFNLVDRVIEVTDDRIVTIKNVSAAEEYLQDHFPGFPVLPGVMMVESLVQAARALLNQRGIDQRMVLGSVRALKYGTFVKPGETLRVEVTLGKSLPEGGFEFKGEGTVVPGGGVSSGDETGAVSAVSGKFVLRPVRTDSVS